MRKKIMLTACLNFHPILYLRTLMVNKQKLDRGYGAVHAPLAPGRHRYFRFNFRFYFRLTSGLTSGFTSGHLHFSTVQWNKYKQIVQAFGWGCLYILRPPTNLSIDQASTYNVHRRKINREYRGLSNLAVLVGLWALFALTTKKRGLFYLVLSHEYLFFDPDQSHIF